MPRVNGIMQTIPGSYGVPNRPIESAKYNAQLDDLVADLNAPRPITAGGTGATTAADALTALGGVSQNTLDEGVNARVKKAGDTMTGPLSFDPGAVLVLTGGTTELSYAVKSRRDIELRSGANVLNITNVPRSGGDYTLDVLFTAGTLGFSQTVRWKIGGGAESTNLADTGVTLTAGVRYTVVLWNMGGALYGVIG